MNRDLNNAFGALAEKLRVEPSSELTGKILLVNYITRRIHVKPRGFGVLKNIPVQKGIILGTVDRPVIVAGDLATLRRKRNDRWKCVAIQHKEWCAVTVSGVADDVETDTFNSFIQQTDAALEIPQDLRLPPIEQLGQLSLPDFRFPDGTTFLCGMPPCTDCGTPSVGKVIVISSDDDHPLCWKFDFRVGAGGFYVLYNTQDIYKATSITSGGGTGVSRPAWSLGFAGYTQRSLTPALASQLTIAAFNLGSVAGLYYTGDDALTWALVHSIGHDYSIADKTKFDQSSRSLGWQASVAEVTSAEISTYDGRYDLGAGFHSTASIEALFYVNANVQALEVHISADGGASWTAILLEYLGQRANIATFPVITGWVEKDDPQWLNPEGSFCSDLPNHMWAQTNDDIPGITTIDQFYYCANTTSVGVGTGFPSTQKLVVAPLHDSSQCYLIVSYLDRNVSLVGTATSTPHYALVNTGENQVYLVDSSGTLIDTFQIPVGLYGTNATDVLAIAETDPTDQDLIYTVSTFRHLGTIRFSTQTYTVLTPPYSLSDLVLDIAITSLGTVLIPTRKSSNNKLILYRSTDDGGSWTTIDLSAFQASLGIPQRTNPYIGIAANGMIGLETDAGKLVFSTDDGATWSATGAILLPATTNVDVDA